MSNALVHTIGRDRNLTFQCASSRDVHVPFRARARFARRKRRLIRAESNLYRLGGLCRSPLDLLPLPAGLQGLPGWVPSRVLLTKNEATLMGFTASPERLLRAGLASNPSSRRLRPRTALPPTRVLESVHSQVRVQAPKRPCSPSSADRHHTYRSRSVHVVLTHPDGLLRSQDLGCIATRHRTRFATFHVCASRLAVGKPSAPRDATGWPDKSSPPATIPAAPAPLEECHSLSAAHRITASNYPPPKRCAAAHVTARACPLVVAPCVALAETRASHTPSRQRRTRERVCRRANHLASPKRSAVIR